MNNADLALFRRLDLNLLVAFDALVTERNVTRAATRLHLGQPAVSAALARLREMFGDELLYREGAAMVPTARALELAPRVRALLDEVRLMTTPAERFDPARLAGEVRLALNDPLEALLLPGLTARLRELAPRLDLRVQPIPASQQLDRLDAGEIRLAVGYFGEARAVHDEQALHVARFVCVFNPALVRLDAPVTLAQVATLPNIHTSYGGEGPGLVDRAFARARLKRRVVVRTATPLSIPFVLRRSPFVALVPELMTPLFGGLADLRFAPLADAEVEFPVSMVSHRRDRSDPLVGFLRREVAGVAAEVFGAG
ncbi:LysR family transcriptional regulator [Derxia gummosa]|uniref:LysR family transcriptional regulator n=1 Tax=Derxia gummosa DSM 723 TaxID=1121388 RepID=A0A9U5CZR3_9BURK|nr:LysR family transcriptional regulator [Derxia gummosa]